MPLTNIENPKNWEKNILKTQKINLLLCDIFSTRNTIGYLAIPVLFRFSLFAKIPLFFNVFCKVLKKWEITS